MEEEDEEDSEMRVEGEGGSMLQKAKPAVTSRTVTLNTLMDDGVIQPGKGVLSIDYLGQRFEADLLENGKIRWDGSEEIFGTPSAWAHHCKRLVNPIKRSGCGWASVKYNNKKLDIWKSIWARKNRVSSPYKQNLSDTANIPQKSPPVNIPQKSPPVNISNKSPVNVPQKSPPANIPQKSPPINISNKSPVNVSQKSPPENVSQKSSPVNIPQKSTVNIPQKSTVNIPQKSSVNIPQKSTPVSQQNGNGERVVHINDAKTLEQTPPSITITNTTNAKPGNTKINKFEDLKKPGDPLKKELIHIDHKFHTPNLVEKLSANSFKILSTSSPGHVSNSHRVPSKTDLLSPLVLSSDILNSQLSQSLYPQRKSVSYSALGTRSLDIDHHTFVQCEKFDQHSKLQPFTVSVTSNSLLLMDFHCNLTKSEVIGYLGGRWDTNKQHLSIEQVFPAFCRLGDSEKSPLVEEDIRQNMRAKQLTLVGWYHSHPFSQCDPTLHDIDCQMSYQLKMRGSGSMYQPCLAFILSPFDRSSSSLDSQIQAFWVMPNLEHPAAYNIPMHVTFSIERDTSLTEEILADMKHLSEYYSGAQDKLNLKDKWKETITYLEKIRASMKSKLPEDQLDSGTFLDYMLQLLRDMK